MYIKKICGNCKYHQHEDIDDGWVCVNDSSENLADWTETYDSCEHFVPDDRFTKED